LARFRLELGPIPFYHQVYLDMRAMIDDGRWPAGHHVPPERELARQYGVSLITVRRALDELAREQRIERNRGRGTFVLAPRIDRDIDEPLSFSEEMQRRGLNPQTRLIAARPEKATERVAAALELEPGSPTLFVERLRVADGDPFLLEQAYLPAERFPGLLNADLETSSLYRLLSERYDTHVARSRETFEPVVLRSREAALLGLKPRTPALLVEGISFSDERIPVEYSHTFVRGDRSRYYVERTVRVNREHNRPRPEGRTLTTTSPMALAAATPNRGGER
jgi:GntR family transcriptional regulator